MSIIDIKEAYITDLTLRDRDRRRDRSRDRRRDRDDRGESNGRSFKEEKGGFDEEDRSGGRF